MLGNSNKDVLLRCYHNYIGSHFEFNKLILEVERIETLN